MLIRILADNPGPSFTKNMDGKFVDTIKTLLRQSRDPSVQQIMRETLGSLEHEKAYDTNLVALITMWRKERGFGTPRGQQPPQQPTPAMSASPNPGQRSSMPIGAPMGPQAYNPQVQPRTRSQRQPAVPQGYAEQPMQLPDQAELASRIEEARTSAKLLIQLTQTTPPRELETNELIKEFANRCTSAQRSLQGYMECRNPAPDEQTFQTLIETCEQLYLAQSKHQRAVLAARRMTSPPAMGGQQRQAPQNYSQRQMPQPEMSPANRQTQQAVRAQRQIPQQVQIQRQPAQNQPAQNQPAQIQPAQIQRQLGQGQIPRTQSQSQQPQRTMQAFGGVVPPPTAEMQAQLQRRTSKEPSPEPPSILRSNTDTLHALPAQDPFADDMSEDEDARNGFAARPEAYLRARSQHPGIVELPDSNDTFNQFVAVPNHTRAVSSVSTENVKNADVAAPTAPTHEYDDDDEDMYDPPAKSEPRQAEIQVPQSRLSPPKQTASTKREVSPLRDNPTPERPDVRQDVSSDGSPVATTSPKPIAAALQEDGWQNQRQAWASRAAAAQSQNRTSLTENNLGAQTNTTSPTSVYTPKSPEKVGSIGTPAPGRIPSLKTTHPTSAPTITKSVYPGYEEDRASYEEGDDQVLDANAGDNRLTSRIKDDDPMTPMTPGTAAQWKY